MIANRLTIPLPFYGTVHLLPERTAPGQTKKMIHAFLIAVLSLSSTVVVSVSAINAHHAHSLVERKSWTKIPRAPLEKKEYPPDLIARQITGENACPFSLWYVSPTIIILITSFPQPT
jgi:hypothetical protein